MPDQICTSKEHEREIGFLNKRISVLELAVQIVILKSGLEKIAVGIGTQAELAKKTLEEARQYGLSL